MENNTKVGRVRHLNIPKSYGFLRCEGSDYFFHMTAFNNEDDFYDSVPGSKLSFTPTVGDRGNQATKISLIKK